MLRIILLIVITYIVVRIALRLLLSESPGQRRSRMHSGQQGKGGVRNDHPFFRSASHGPGKSRPTGPERFDDIEDAEFEEIKPREGKEGRKEKK